MFLGCGAGWSVRILSLRCGGWAASPALLICALRELLASDSRRRGREAQAGSHDDLTEWRSQPSLIVLRSEIAPRRLHECQTTEQKLHFFLIGMDESDAKKKFREDFNEYLDPCDFGSDK